VAGRRTAHTRKLATAASQARATAVPGNAAMDGLTLILVKWVPTLRAYAETANWGTHIRCLRSCKAARGQARRAREQAIEEGYGSWPSCRWNLWI
jgi:hypothetical protein